MKELYSNKIFVLPSHTGQQEPDTATGWSQAVSQFTEEHETNPAFKEGKYYRQKWNCN